jgi:hypothetical protein
MAIVVSFEKELREAFSAGQMSVLHKLYAGKKGAADSKFLTSIPKTYEEWQESIRSRPKVVRG